VSFWVANKRHIGLGAGAAGLRRSLVFMPAPYDLTREELQDLLAGEPAYRARQVWDGLHVRAQRPAEMTELSAPLRAQLEEALPPALTEVTRRTADAGQTTKWLWSLGDGSRVESVLMQYPDRVTVCVSTQAGCAMACQFCATGQAGFQRHLTEGEIVEQVVAAVRSARPRRLSNVVFMGMGEPLANYDRVWAAVRRLHGDVGLSARHLTLSTVGIVPGIRRLAAETLPVNLAVSLHAANDALRDELVPINRRYPLGLLAEACADYVAASGRRLSIEWAMIDGVNDRGRDAEELAAFARPLRAHVNLIPLNPTPGYPVVGSPAGHVRRFREELDGLGINATVRSTRGVEIDAACGQLAAAVASPSLAPSRVRLTRPAADR
jgi:23S rRNA (adenine2503-C2)-methyltransferase